METITELVGYCISGDLEGAKQFAATASPPITRDGILSPNCLPLRMAYLRGHLHMALWLQNKYGLIMDDAFRGDAKTVMELGNGTPDESDDDKYTRIWTLALCSTPFRTKMGLDARPLVSSSSIVPYESMDALHSIGL